RNRRGHGYTHGPEYPDRRTRRRPAARTRHASRTRRALGPRQRLSAPASPYPFISCARVNASRKSKHTGFVASIIFLNNPNSVLYLILPMASGPMPRVACGFSSTPFDISSRASTSGGWTVFHAATLREGFDASRSVADIVPKPAPPADPASALSS